MNHDIADKWIAALESGKYSQAREALRTTDGFCCLGVLSDLYIKEHPKEEWTVTSLTISNLTETFYSIKDTDPCGADYASTVLPRQVQDWAGMSSESGHFMERNSASGPSLVFYNDQLKFSFKEIANIIRHNKENL
jgi:hypothetical protein